LWLVVILLVGSVSAAQAAYLGVTVRDHPSGEGVEVVDVAPGSPAEAVRIRKGFHILSIDGWMFEDAQDFVKRIQSLPTDIWMTLLHKQNGRFVFTGVVLAEGQQDFSTNAYDPPKAGYIGATARPEPDGSKRVVRIIHVAPFGPAARAGLREGDVVTHLGGVPIVSWVVFMRVVRNEPGRTLEIRILRDGRRLAGEVTLQTLRVLRPGESPQAVSQGSGFPCLDSGKDAFGCALLGALIADGLSQRGAGMAGQPDGPGPSGSVPAPDDPSSDSVLQEGLRGY
jgi:S1-C subfamily serine protease